MPRQPSYREAWLSLRVVRWVTADLSSTFLWTMGRRQRLQELLEDCRIADAVYEDTPERFAEMTVLERDDILLFEHEADHFRSAYAIALVPDRKEARCCSSVAA